MIIRFLYPNIPNYTNELLLMTVFSHLPLKHSLVVLCCDLIARSQESVSPFLSRIHAVFDDNQKHETSG